MERVKILTTVNCSADYTGVLLSIFRHIEPSFPFFPWYNFVMQKLLIFAFNIFLILQLNIYQELSELIIKITFSLVLMLKVLVNF